MKILSLILSMLIAYGIYCGIGWVVTLMYVIMAIFAIPFSLLIIFVKKIDSPIKIQSLYPADWVCSILTIGMYIFVFNVTENYELLCWYLGYLLLAYTAIITMYWHNAKLKLKGIK